MTIVSGPRKRRYGAALQIAEASLANTQASRGDFLPIRSGCGQWARRRRWHRVKRWQWRGPWVVAKVLGLFERMVRLQLRQWVKDGWLRVADPSRRKRAYVLTAIYRQYIDKLSAMPGLGREAGRAKGMK